MPHLDRPVICPVLIGRAPYVETLDRYLDLAADHQGQTLLVAGEAGVGKSRLAADARQRAASRGMAVLEGCCFESHRSVPYAPLIDLLRAAARAEQPFGSWTQQLAESIGPGARELARILPELGQHVAGAATATEQPEQERHRLFRVLVDGICRLAADRPALVIVEDAHWSDDASLDFLEDLARQVPTLPMLLLVTYRDDEVSRAVSKLLATLDRQRLAAELRLGRLERAEVGEMLQAICGLDRPVSPDFLDAVFSLTDGNPFFVEEVLRSLIAVGDVEVTAADGAWVHHPVGQLRVPRSVRDAVERRAEGLSAAGRHVLSIAAVAGHRFDIDLVKALTGQDEAEVVETIKELLAAGLVVEESADRFAFRHALTREAVRAGLLARERKALHQTIAETLEQLHGQTPGALDAHVADLAHHFHEAGAWDRVMRYAPRAGERAMALYAPRAAVEHFARALEAAPQLGLQPPMGLLRAQGQAYDLLGDFESARGAFEAVLEQARVAGDRFVEWQALADLGAAWIGRSYERGGQYYQVALVLARQIREHDPRPLAQTLNCIGNWHTNLEEPAEAVHHHEEALALFRSLDDRRGIAETLDYLGMASYLAGDPITAARYFEEAVPILRELDHRQGLASTLATLAIARAGGTFGDLLAPPMTEPGSAWRDAEAALTIAREIGWRAGEAYSLNCVSNSTRATGAYARALETALEAQHVAEALEHREWMVYARNSLGTIYLDLLAVSEAESLFNRAVEMSWASGSRYWIRFSSAGAALACVEQGDYGRAALLLEGLVDLSRPAQTWAERAVWYVHARLALSRGDPATALRLIDLLIASDQHAAQGQVLCRPTYVRGEALAALGRPAEAEAALQIARRKAAGRDARPLLWRIEAALGRVAGGQGRRRESQEAFAAARAIVDQIAGEVTEPGLRTQFLNGVEGLVPRPRPPTSRQAVRQAFDGLTARERDVAALVGQGKSNREIADALVLGERTVQTHVSSILGKLSFTSRTQIAVWATDRGLSDDS
ncbi:MAG: helix-turn-helix transcriptional regulator [Chloroflexota bacterium]